MNFAFLLYSFYLQIFNFPTKSEKSKKSEKIQTKKLIKFSKKDKNTKIYHITDFGKIRDDNNFFMNFIECSN